MAKKTDQKKISPWERRSHELSPRQWQALDKLAEEVGAHAERGSSFGEPTWRALLRQLADGEFILTRKFDHAPSPLQEHESSLSNAD